MATYLIYVHWTDQGRQNFRETVERGELVDTQLAAAGATVTGHYWPLGGHDVLIVADAPDEETVRAVSLEIQGRGNSHITIQRGYSSEEMKHLIQQADNAVAAA